jgi:RimJ/RimL family protein N-acetyltransferase
MIAVRPASAEDEQRILAWANDPVARASGFRPEPITPDAHHRWFAARLAEPDTCRIWIGLDGQQPIGVVRVEQDADGFLVVSIALDPAQRGRGKSRPLLEAGLDAARAAFPEPRFRAWIRDDNRASLALFEGSGFEAPRSRLPTTPPGAGTEAVVLERD